jgi:shikimate kinase
MGVGKSTIAEQLSKHLFCRHTDLDKAVEASEGLSVEQIFALRGEPFFREAEEKILNDIVTKNSEKVLVLSLGGGALISGKNRRLLKENAYCIYLRASVENIISRLTHAKKTRPLIKDKSEEELIVEIRRLFSVRESGYESSADYVLEMDKKTIHDILSEILGII